jgi:hypothetical protein
MSATVTRKTYLRLLTNDRRFMRELNNYRNTLADQNIALMWADNTVNGLGGDTQDTLKKAANSSRDALAAVL